MQKSRHVSITKPSSSRKIRSDNFEEFMNYLYSIGKYEQIIRAMAWRDINEYQRDPQVLEAEKIYEKYFVGNGLYAIGEDPEVRENIDLFFPSAFGDLGKRIELELKKDWIVFLQEEDEYRRSYDDMSHARSSSFDGVRPERLVRTFTKRRNVHILDLSPKLSAFIDLDPKIQMSYNCLVDLSRIRSADEKKDYSSFRKKYFRHPDKILLHPKLVEMMADESSESNETLIDFILELLSRRIDRIISMWKRRKRLCKVIPEHFSLFTLDFILCFDKLRDDFLDYLIDLRYECFLLFYEKAVYFRKNDDTIVQIALYFEIIESFLKHGNLPLISQQEIDLVLETGYNEHAFDSLIEKVHVLLFPKIEAYYNYCLKIKELYTDKLFQVAKFSTDRIRHGMSLSSMEFDTPATIVSTIADCNRILITDIDNGLSSVILGKSSDELITFYAKDNNLFLLFENCIEYYVLCRCRVINQFSTTERNPVIFSGNKYVCVITSKFPEIIIYLWTIEEFEEEIEPHVFQLTRRKGYLLRQNLCQFIGDDLIGIGSNSVFEIFNLEKMETVLKLQIDSNNDRIQKIIRKDNYLILLSLYKIHLFLLEKDEIERIHHIDFEGTDIVSCIYFHESGVLFVGCASGTIYRTFNNEFTTFCKVSTAFVDTNDNNLSNLRHQLRNKVNAISCSSMYLIAAHNKQISIWLIDNNPTLLQQYHTQNQTTTFITKTPTHFRALTPTHLTNITF